MQLFIPALSTKLILAQDWTFRLFREHRNSTLFEQFGANWWEREDHPQWQHIMPVKTRDELDAMSWDDRHDYYDNQETFLTVTLPAGRILSVARIYVRSGQKGFDSVTFRLMKEPKKKTGARFWVKLADANNIKFEVEA